MEPISNVDRLVLILRQKLSERSKSAGTGRAASARTRAEPVKAGLDNVQALAGVDGIDDRTLGRALIQSILAEEFGSEMINEARFQQIVDRVNETLLGDHAGADLLKRLVAELRAQAR